MAVNDPLEQARRSYRRSYVLQSVLVMIFVIAAAIAATWKIVQTSQPPMWQILIPPAFWAFALYAAWILRRNYVRSNVNDPDKAPNSRLLTDALGLLPRRARGAAKPER